MRPYGPDDMPLRVSRWLEPIASTIKDIEDGR